MTAPDTLFQRYLPFRAFRGDYGVLYLCSDLDTHEAVALKTFVPELNVGQSAESLLRAAEDWIRIGPHPHVVTAHRIQDDAPLCLVLDFVEPAQGLESPSLRGWMKTPIVPEAACAIALGIARGMRCATDRVDGLVHGDLRPSNVLIGRDLRARVTDFGLGFQKAPPELDLPEFGRYWAPERWSGISHLQSDIFAFGLILLEMLVGSAVVVSVGPPGPETARGARNLALTGDVPEVLRALLASCLAPTADLRPGSWMELDHRLTALWPRLSGRDVPKVPDELTAAREESLMRAWSSQEIGHALRDRGDFEAALLTYRGVARAAAREGDPALEASAVSHGALMLRTLGNEDAATRELLHSMELRRAHGDARGLAEVMFLLGDIYANRGDADNALASLFGAARTFAEAGDRRGVAACRKRMVPVLDAVGRGTEAREAEGESAAIIADLDD